MATVKYAITSTAKTRRHPSSPTNRWAHDEPSSHTPQKAIKKISLHAANPPPTTTTTTTRAPPPQTTPTHTHTHTHPAPHPNVHAPARHSRVVYALRLGPPVRGVIVLEGQKVDAVDKPVQRYRRRIRRSRLPRGGIQRPLMSNWMHGSKSTQQGMRLKSEGG